MENVDQLDFMERGGGRGSKRATELIGPVLTLAEVADILRVHPSTIYRLVKRKEIPAFKVGSDWRFDIKALDEWRLGTSRQSPEKK
jgi:excisionase family DNA binding protein